MKTFRVIFANNKPVSCREMEGHECGRRWIYEQTRGRLIYAFIKADDAQAAINSSRLLAMEFQRLRS